MDPAIPPKKLPRFVRCFRLTNPERDAVKLFICNLRARYPKEKKVVPPTKEEKFKNYFRRGVPKAHEVDLDVLAAAGARQPLFKPNGEI